MMLRQKHFLTRLSAGPRLLQNVVKNASFSPNPWYDEERTEKGGSSARPTHNRRSWSISRGVAWRFRQNLLKQPKYSVSLNRTVLSRTRNSFDATVHDNFVTKVSNVLGQAYSAHANGERREEYFRQLSGEFEHTAAEQTSQSRPSSSVKNLLLSAERECTAKVNDLDIDSLLYLADTFFLLQYPCSNFLAAVLRKVEHEWLSSPVTPSQLVHLLFLLAMKRVIPAQLSERIESLLLKHMDSFSSDDVLLICFAFFSTNTRINNIQLLNKIAEQDVFFNPQPHNVFFMSSALKVFKHTLYQNLDFYSKHSNSIVKYPQTLQPIVIMHIANTYCANRVYNQSLFSRLGQDLSECLDSSVNQIRTKDLARITWSFGQMRQTLPVEAPDRLILMYSSSQQQMWQHVQTFTEALAALALLNIYPRELIDVAFSEKYFLHRKKKRLLFANHLQFLHTVLSINCDWYKELPHVTDFIKNIPVEWKGNFYLELLKRQGLSSVYLSIQRLLPDPNMVRCGFVLEFSRIMDLEMILDEENRPTLLEQPAFSDSVLHLLSNLRTSKVPQEKKSITSRLLEEHKLANEEERPSPENLHLQPNVKPSSRKIIIKVFGSNQYAINAPVLLGVYEKEVRLLCSLGYEVYTINPVAAQELDTMDKIDCDAYVMDILVNKLKVKLA